MRAALVLDHPAEPQPLDTVVVHGAGTGRLCVLDGQGRAYLDAPAADPFRFQLGGALGGQVVLHLDDAGRLLGSAGVRVTARTGLDDGGRLKALFDDLHYTLITSFGGRQFKRIGGRLYQHFVSWLRDHTHTAKAMQWFCGGLKSGFELYAERQQPNGMIWDRCYPRGPWQQWRDFSFRHHGCMGRPQDGVGFERIPIENDVEFLFIECLWRTWKATGDTAWMARWLDHALKALHYSTHDGLRWSAHYRLLKRGYTIDTWDFINDIDGADTVDEHGIRLGDNVILAATTKFGVFHGDNVGMAQSCSWLAEMLRTAGRAAEADAVAGIGAGIRERIDALSWNGSFYRHWVPEPDAVRERDFGGTDETQVVTLSNAYAVNRAIGPAKAKAIVGTYQRIRSEMPASSPGEWYTCYPPFRRNFHNPMWEYMNGGVSSIVAGELARGACEVGEERYAADILLRLADIAARHGGRLPVCLKGAREPQPPAAYRMLDLAPLCNCDLRGDAPAGVIPWLGEGDKDVRACPVGEVVFGEVPCRIADPAANGRRAAIALGRDRPYAAAVAIPASGTCRSLYLFHTVALWGGGIVGTLHWRYADGSEDVVYVQSGRHVDHWFLPQGPALADGPEASGDSEGAKHRPAYRLAWRGANPVHDNVGIFLAGFANPHPDRPLAAIELRAPQAGHGRWFVLAATLSDQAVRFPEGEESYGIPNNWGAAAVLYALMEGIAGIENTGQAFSALRLRPRWAAAGVDRASACVHLPDSDGYAACRYQRSGDRIALEVTTCATAYDAALLLPDGFVPRRLEVDGAEASIAIDAVDGSRYLRLPLTGLGVHRVVVLG